MQNNNYQGGYQTYRGPSDQDSLQHEGGSSSDDADPNDTFAATARVGDRGRNQRMNNGRHQVYRSTQNDHNSKGRQHNQI